MNEEEETQELDMFGAEHKEHKSKYNTDGGFKFQRELFLHFAIRFRQLNYPKFIIGYEVKTFGKFEDCVFEFENGGKKYGFSFDSKHREDSPRFYGDLKKHLNEIIGFKEEKFKNVKNPPNFLMFSNTSFADYIMDCLEDLPETHYLSSIFGEIFLKKKETLLQKITDAFRAHFSRVLQDDENFNFVKENLILVSNSPNLNDLKELNREILVNEFGYDETDQIFTNNVRQDVIDYIKVFKINNQSMRKTLKKSDFESILMNCVLKTDLPNISKEFSKEFHFKVTFNSDILQKWFKRLTSKEVLCADHLELNGFKIFQAIKKPKKEAFLVRLSKLTPLQKTALESWKQRNIVILIDEDYNKLEELKTNTNLYFAKKADMSHPETTTTSFSFNDLSEISKTNLLETFIKIQNVNVRLKQVMNMNVTEEYKKIMKQFIIELIKKKHLELGKDIPKDECMDVYLERRFVFTEEIEDVDKIKQMSSGEKILHNFHQYFEKVLKFLNIMEEETILEVELFSKYTQCIIKGNVGVGKSSTLQKLAHDFKKSNPSFWIEFLKLKDLRLEFDSISSEFTESEAKEFLLNKILNYGENSELGRNLIEYYLTFQEPQIILILDGFDDIMPTYEARDVNFIKKISKLKIKIFISVSNENEKHLEELDFKVVSLKEFKESEWLEFSKRYMDKSNVEIDYDSETLTHLLERPLFPKMLLDTFIEKYCNQTENNEKLKIDLTKMNIITIYEKTFAMCFDRFCVKAEMNPKNPRMTVILKELSKRIKNNLGKIAVEELDLKDFIPVEEVSDDAKVLDNNFLKESENGKKYFENNIFAEYFCAIQMDNHVKKNQNKIQKDLWEAARKTEGMRDFYIQIIILNIVQGVQEVLPSVESQSYHLDFLKCIYIKSIESCSPSEFQSVTDSISKVSEEYSSYFHPYVFRNDFFEHGRYMLFFEECKKFECQDIAWEFLRQTRKDIWNKYTETEDLHLVTNEMNKILETYNTYGDSEKDHFQDFASEIFSLKNNEVAILWYFENTSWNKDDFMKILTTFPEDKDLLSKCISVLHKNKKSFKNNNIFIEACCSSYEIVDLLEVISKFSGNDSWFRICFEDFRGKNNNLLLPDQKSILYYFWEGKETNIVDSILKLLTKNELLEMTFESSSFGGITIVDYFHLEENGDYIPESYLKRIFKYFKETGLEIFLLPYRSDQDISLEIRRTFRICISLSNFEKPWKLIINDFYETLDVENKNKFLYEVLKLENNHYNEIILHIFKSLETPSTLLKEKLNEIDEEGNIPIVILICQNSNWIIFKILFQILANAEYNYIVYNSLLYHCWIQKKPDLSKIILYFLKKEDISISRLTEESVFGGTSLLNEYHSKNDIFFWKDDNEKSENHGMDIIYHYMTYLRKRDDYEQNDYFKFLASNEESRGYYTHLNHLSENEKKWKKFILIKKDLVLCHKFIDCNKIHMELFNKLIENISKWRMDQNEFKNAFKDEIDEMYNEPLKDAENPENIHRKIFELTDDIQNEMLKISCQTFYRNEMKILNALGFVDFKILNEIFHELWLKNDDKIFKYFLNELPKDKIKELTKSPNFGRKSVLDVLRSEEKWNDCSLSYLTFLILTNDYEELSTYLSYNEDHSNNLLLKWDMRLIIQILLRSEYTYIMRFCSFLRINRYFWDDESYPPTKFCNEILKLRREHSSSFNIFHYIPYDLFENSNVLIDEFLERIIKTLKGENSNRPDEFQNLFEEMFTEVDKNGNTPMNIYIRYPNVFKTFHRVLLNIYNDFTFNEEFIKLCLKIVRNQNNEGKNILHLLGEGLISNTSSCINFNCLILDEYIPRVFLEKKSSFYLKVIDNNGRTPLHTKYGHLYLYYIPENEKDFFCTKVDKDGNNIFHHLAQWKILNPASFTALAVFVQTSSSLIKEVIKTALKEKKNKENKTPIDIAEQDLENKDEKVSELDFINIIDAFKKLNLVELNP